MLCAPFWNKVYQDCHSFENLWDLEVNVSWDIKPRVSRSHRESWKVCTSNAKFFKCRVIFFGSHGKICAPTYFLRCTRLCLVTKVTGKIFLRGKYPNWKLLNQQVQRATGIYAFRQHFFTRKLAHMYPRRCYTEQLLTQLGNDIAPTNQISYKLIYIVSWR